MQKNTSKINSKIYIQNIKSIFLFLITILVTSCASVEKYNTQITKLHPVEDLHSDIDKVYKQLKRNHPHLYQFTSKETLDFKFDSLKKAIVSPMDSRSFYKQLSQVTRYVGQGHMSITPPFKRFDKKERKALNKMKFDINNLDFEYLDNKLLIVNARGNDSLLVGSEVVMVENEKPTDLIHQYKKRFASDGYNTTFHNRVLGTRFMRYYVMDKGRFDSISLTLKNADSTYTKFYKRAFKDKFVKKASDSIHNDSLSILKKPKVKLTKAERKIKKLEAKAKRKHNSKYGYIANREEYTRNLNFVGKDSSVALLKIRGFSNGNYEAFYDEAFKTLDSLNTETLVIDLRNNFGGRLKEITYLYSYLTDEEFVMINPSETNTRSPLLKSLMSNSRSNGVKVFAGLLSPFIYGYDLFKTKKKNGQLYYKFKSSKAQEPQLNNFRGKIYVLINGNSFSASSLLSTKLHGDQRATLVGEETGGAYNGTVAGFYKVYELPHTKVKARIGLAHIDAPHKIDPDGYGVKPDIEILPTYQDRLNNVDPELDWILQDIESKKVN